MTGSAPLADPVCSKGFRYRWCRIGHAGVMLALSAPVSS